MPSSDLADLGRGVATAARPARRVLRLSAEGAFFTACAIAAAGVIAAPHAGFFAVFLCAAGLAGRFDDLLDENRRAHAEESSLRVNARTARDVLALFLGVFAAFVAAAAFAGEARMAADYAFVIEASGLGRDTILTRRFDAMGSIAAHNLAVLAVFCALSCVYRAYGALLAIAWNACIWALVFAFLVRRAMRDGGSADVGVVVLSGLAVLPHLVLEAAAYVLGALASIFLSKAVARYSSRDAVFREILRSVAILGAASIGGILLGAVVESTLPGWVLARVAP